LKAHEYCVLDIETDGLFATGSKIHCVAVKSNVEGRVIGLAEHSKALAKEFSAENPDVKVMTIAEAFRFAFSHNQVVGHNLIAFDIPWLERYLGLKCDTSKVFDTLIAARLTEPDVLQVDINRRVPAMPSELYGSHSLKSWGYRIGVKKDAFGDDREDWTTCTVPMLNYCMQDLEVTEALFKFLANVPSSAMRLEQEFAVEVAKMTNNGFSFDVVGAATLYGKLSMRREELKTELELAFPASEVKMKRKVKSVPFNPASRTQIAARLIEKYNWQPKEFTDGGSVKIDETVLSKLPWPEAQKLSEFFLIQKRIGQLAEGDKAWMKLVKADSRIHGEIITIGAVTGRCSHQNPNMAQVPKQKEYRSLFRVPEGKTLVGIDCSGLQLRCLAHYMALYDGGDYVKVITSGDIHTENQKAAGLPTRDSAKTFIYALLFGAGDERLGEILGGGAVEGRKLRDKFMKGLPAFKRLTDSIQGVVKGRGDLRGLDARRLPIRSKHAALNTLLMAAEAIIVKTFTVHLMRHIGSMGRLVAHVHDELQIEVDRPEDVAKIKALADVAIEQTQKSLNFRCPLKVESKVGTNWSETH
jgi:DNA polymerase-1